MTLDEGSVGTGAVGKEPVEVTSKEPVAKTLLIVAVIKAEPEPTTETTPNSLTVATLVSEDKKSK